MYTERSLALSSPSTFSPKYAPPVSSRTMRMSTPSRTSGLIVEAGIRAGIAATGLRFANASKDFLSFKSPASGRIGSRSKSGCPTAPSRTASDAFALSNVSSEIGAPSSRIAVPPILRSS